MHAAYTLSKSLNYANDDQIPFGNGPIDPLNLHREYGPTPNDQRNRFVVSGTADLKWGFQISPLWTIASSVPMDIMLPDNSTRVPQFGRNAGCRSYHNGAQLNAAIEQINANGGENGTPLPLVDPNVSFCNGFNSFDLRLTKQFKMGDRYSLLLGGPSADWTQEEKCFFLWNFKQDEDQARTVGHLVGPLQIGPDFCPEPSTLLLLGPAGVGLLWRLRARHSLRM